MISSFSLFRLTVRLTSECLNLTILTNNETNTLLHSVHQQATQRTSSFQDALVHKPNISANVCMYTITFKRILIISNDNCCKKITILNKGLKVRLHLVLKYVQ